MTEEYHLTSGQHSEVRRRDSLLTDEIISDTGKARTKILAGVTTPYDALLESENSRLQYYLDLIKIRIALSSGTIQLSVAYAAVKLIEDDPEFVIGNTFGPIPETWTPEMISHLIGNIKLLKKSKIIEASKVYSAIIDTLKSASPAKPPSGFLERVFSYFIHNPLTSYSQA